MKTTVPKEKIDQLIRVKNLLIGMVIFLVILIFFVLLNILNTDKINWGMKTAGIKIGGLTSNQAEEKIETANEEFLKKAFTLSYENNQWQITPEKLGMEINVAETAKMAFAYGRNGKNIFINSWQQLESLFGYNLSPIWKIDSGKMEEFLNTNLSSIYHPAQNAMLIYDEKKQDFSVVTEKEGITIDKEKIEKIMEKDIINLQQTNIRLALIKDRPEILGSEIQQAYKEIKTILESLPLSVVIIDDSISSASETKKEIDKIDKEELLNLIAFEPIIDPKNPDNKILGIGINQEKAKNYLISLAPLINQEPIDAKLSFKNEKVSIFALSQDGIRMEIDENIPNLFTGIKNGEEINLKITKIKPAITTESIDNLGITALLGKGSSNFSGSPVNRIHNIKIGAAKFNGVLLKPNEEFSFNAILGDVGPEQGYEPELVIKQDKTVPEYGGGLCQVSTTVFRAAVYSGLKITERFPHAFPVKYYNPQGFDATIYPPSPDLKFINNTPGYILFQSKIIGSEITFEVYGTDDGRKVKLDGPSQYEVKEDGSMKAVLVQEVYDKDDNLMFKKSFYSNYRSPSLFPVIRNPLE